MLVQESIKIEVVGVFPLKVVMLRVKEMNLKLLNDLAIFFKLLCFRKLLVSWLSIVVLIVVVALLTLNMDILSILMTAFVHAGFFLKDSFVERQLFAENLDVVGSLFLDVLFLDDENEVHDKEHDDVHSEGAESSGDGSAYSSNVCQEVLHTEVLILEHLLSKRESEVKVHFQIGEVVDFTI